MTASELQVCPAIGLEVHVRLATQSKMFCRCPVEFGVAPNTRVCPLCLGLPGALPVMNRKAFEHSVLVGELLEKKLCD